MKEYDVVFEWQEPNGERETRIQIGVTSLSAARNSALAAPQTYPTAIGLHVEVIDSDQICDCCMGDGKMVAKFIDRDHVEWKPCDCCNGTGNESGRPTKTYLSKTFWKDAQ
jgi:DnaJ-class molecular chaperone